MNVIIIEDEPLTRMDLRAMLERNCVMVLGEGKDGFDAINLCKMHKPDVVIMDVNLPYVDGISAAKIIRKGALSRSVVLATAYSEEKFIERAQEAGVDGYLVKPVDDRTLLPTIRIALSKAIEREKTEKELALAVKKLESRKVVERAKGLIMQNENISEQAAFEKLRTLSMEKNCSLEEIGEIFLVVAENQQ